ncbi:hypothetical protein RJ639_029051 [Escallonia herrerae]|uniref:Uncharacterized protein n=1 Tax=Escallonia herrerae TaxID=1293975 RepID=A0AA89BDC8_9ASTE|nr:hypothetical protein RJ639_029051 [Escallonia herrerae]
MLRTPPSVKLDLSSFARETKASQKSSMADKVRSNGDIRESNFSAATEPDASENLAAGVSTSHALPGPSACDLAYNGSRDEPSSLLPALFVSDPNQDSKLGQIVEAEGGASESHNSTMQELSSMQHLDTNPRSSDGNLSTEKDLTDCRTAPNANNLPSSEFSLSAGIMIESHRQSGEDVSNAASSDHDILKSNVPVQETCALLSEASIEVPVVYETNSKLSGSQTSSSMRGEELSQDTSQVDTKCSLVGNNAGSTIEKQPQKKPSGYHRKGRGRGR